MTDPISEVRAFNRFYTGVIGVLAEGLLHTPYSLTEGRVIFELAQRDETEVAALRGSLGLDAGYLSRILARFEADGLVTRQQSTVDARRQVVRLTKAGRKVFATLDARSSREVTALLARLDEPGKHRLLAAMGTVRRLLAEPAAGGDALAEPAAGGNVLAEPAAGGNTTAAAAVTLREPGPGDFGWVIARHGALYAAEYGWDATLEAFIARIVADFVDHRDPARERGWIAEVDGAPAGCVFCVRADDQTAQLRLLLVEPSARGTGIGARLVEECLAFARAAGYRRITLWTNDVLVDARRLYERAGFSLVRREPHRSFGQDLVAEVWQREL
jgi:DNA-binding MarR family transcriptional regulator/predicted N-acetyltransferase YhbS